MAKAKTFFEQVPLALALQIAARQDGHEPSVPVLCGICGAPVELECCKINEFGQAVHGKCYVARIASPSRSQVHRGINRNSSNGASR